MRKFALCLPILALSACSAFEQPFVQSGNHNASGHYSTGCAPVSCAPGQSYSVAGTSHQNAYHAGGDFHGGANARHWPDMNRIPAYESGGSVHINPTGFGHHGHGGYGVPQVQGQAQGYGYGYNYGQPPHLRGLYGPKRGNFYGTLGGVMYDTDADSFGLEGRIGYDSGRIFGAEIEGSLGLIDETSVLPSAVGPIDVEGGFDYNVAAFALARLPLSKRFTLHARGGYDFRDISVTATAQDGTSATASESLDGFAYGVGAEYALTPRDGLRLDFTRYDNDIGASESVSASYTRKF